jgi:hypothetical protein
MVKEITILSLQKEIKKLEDRIKKLEVDVKNNGKLKKTKDPNEPKRYKSAYMFFNLERINEHKKKFPNKKIKVTEIARESGIEWQKIKEDEKKYEKYKKLEDDDKKRYRKDLEKYEKNKKDEEH